MSLNYELGKIKDWETVTKITSEYNSPADGIKIGDKIMNPVTSALIFGCISVGIGEITEANVEEWYCRFEINERVMGRSIRYMDATKPDRVITYDEVKAHIGLRTNVFPKVKPAMFLDNLMRDVRPR